jgi:hypothetical protein
MKCAWYFVVCLLDQIAGADPGFQVSGGAHLKNLRRAEGGGEHFWGISCEKSRFYAKKSYFCQLRREARKVMGYFVWKITILRPKNHSFSNIRGGVRRVRPLPWIRPWIGTKIFNFVVFRSTISKTPFWRERERMMPHASFVVGYIYSQLKKFDNLLNISFKI